MALRERGRIKRITASGGGTLQADADESFRITDLYCAPSSNDTYLTLYVGGRTVNKIRVKGKAGNHAPYPTVKTTQLYEATFGGLFAALRARGFDMTIPVATGETFKVERYAETGDVTIVYDVYDPGDVANTEPNGSAASVRRYLLYADNSAAVTASPASIDNSLEAAGMDDWPIDGDDVPGNTEFRLHGVLGCPCAAGDGSNNHGYTTHLKLLSDGDVLMDSEDQVGVPFLGDSSVTSATVDYTPVGSLVGPMTAERPYPPLWFPEPLVFTTGRTLTLQVVVGSAGSNGIGANELDVCLALERIVGGGV